MAEWLYEAGIGENRAILVEDGAIVAAEIELPDGGPRVGAILAGRLTDKRRGQLAIEGGEALLSPVPKGLAEGTRLKIEIVREAWPEPGRSKPAKAIPAGPDADPGAGPDLLARLSAGGLPIRHPLPHEPDGFEAAGWSELLNEAACGDIAFWGGRLRVAFEARKQRATQRMREIMEGPERPWREKRFARTPQDTRLRLDATGELLDERGLADARFARHEHRTAAAGGGIAERLSQLAQMSLAFEKGHRWDRPGFSRVQRQYYSKTNFQILLPLEFGYSSQPAHWLPGIT